MSVQQRPKLLLQGFLFDISMIERVHSGNVFGCFPDKPISDITPDSQQEGQYMKTTTGLKAFAAAILLGVPALLMIGCNDPLAWDPLAPPDVSSRENAQRQLRYAGQDQAQLIDDFDRNVTMSRPSGYLTPWNVRTSD